MYVPESTACTVNWPVNVPSAFLVHVPEPPTGVPVMLGGPAHVAETVVLKPAPRTAIVDPADPEVGLRTMLPTTLKVFEGADGSSATFPVAVTVDMPNTEPAPTVKLPVSCPVAPVTVQVGEEITRIAGADAA